jgi:hypothetical protein
MVSDIQLEDFGLFMRSSPPLLLSSLLTAALLTGCSSRPVEGPDKVFAGEITGALQGAGAGAVTGLQVGAGTGPGAVVGAGFGFIAGAISGMIDDQSEEWSMKTAQQVREENNRAVAQETLADHYKRRMSLHPTRDIFPADLFFRGDAVTMCPSGKLLVRELARTNALRLPYSRLALATYIKASDATSDFARHLSEHRALAMVNEFTKAGFEPRRLVARPVIVEAPVLIDPLDHPARYNQAVEIIPLDR